MRLLPFLLVSAALSCSSSAQWTLEESHTTASLRGIDNVGGGVAWASGSSGTVLRTEDGGYLWQTCSMPPGAEKLDFRGIIGLDEKTAVVMSSGKGSLSRLYRTTDACQTWTLVATNADEEGFWDAIQRQGTGRQIVVLGDPVDGVFKVFSMSIDGSTHDGSMHDGSAHTPGSGIVEPTALKGESIFAASNSSMLLGPAVRICFVTGGSAAEMVCTQTPAPRARVPMTRVPLPLEALDSAGAFSIAGAHSSRRVVVGGDYRQPDRSARTEAWSDDWGFSWHLAGVFPHGYRSAVAYDAAHHVWITVGPNGTDVSANDGKDWRPLLPGKQDAAGADRDWNALSLPFVVGPKGRIGRLDENAVDKLRAR